MAEALRAMCGLLVIVALLGGCSAPASEARSPERAAPPPPDPGPTPPDPGPQLATAALVDLCGSPNEAILRAWVPETPARCDAPHRVVHAVSHTSEGTLAVLAWSVSARDGHRSETRAVVLRGGARLDALPLAVPSTPADRDALLLGALLLERGSAHFFVDRREARPILTAWVPYLAGVALGSAADGSVAVLSAPTIGADTEAWSVDRVVARLDAAGRATIGYHTLLRGLGQSTTVTALEGLAPLARASRLLPVCGHAQESAIRLRVPDLPACGPRTSTRYVAVRTTTGELVHVEWAGLDETGRHDRGRRTLLDATFGALELAQLRGATADDDEGVLIANMLAWTEGRVVALDEAGLSEVPAPLDPAVLGARLRGRLGFSDGPHGRALAALVVEEHAAHRDGVDIAALDAFRFDVARDAEGAVRVSRRRLADVENGVEVAGPQRAPEIMRPMEPIGALDGL